MTYALARPLGYLGADEPAGDPAGPVNGIATLRVDVERSARNIAAVYGTSVEYDRADYRRVLRRAQQDANSVSELPARDVKAFVLGVMADVIDGLVRAEQLSLQNVGEGRARAENHRVQAQLIGSARIMLDSANTALGSARGGNGAAGLGNPLVVAGVIAAAAVVYGIIGVAIVLVADAQIRLYQARGEAERICRASGGCTAEQRVELVRRLSLGPLDRIAAGVAEGAETGSLAVGTIAVIAGAGVLAIGGIWFFFGTAAGRRTLKGMRESK